MNDAGSRGMNMDYDVLIIGAGPGGIFTAYELTEKTEKPLRVAVYELGSPLENRKCPIDGEKIKSCVRCGTCSIMSGFGGAGAFSDGKYNITNDFGGSLYEHVGKAKALELKNPGFIDSGPLTRRGSHTPSDGNGKCSAGCTRQSSRRH